MRKSDPKTNLLMKFFEENYGVKFVDFDTRKELGTDDDDCENDSADED